MTLNVKSIRLRLRKLEQYIAELEKQQELDLGEFRDDFTAQPARSSLLGRGRRARLFVSADGRWPLEGLPRLHPGTSYRRR